MSGKKDIKASADARSNAMNPQSRAHNPTSANARSSNAVNPQSSASADARSNAMNPQDRAYNPTSAKKLATKK